MLVLVLVVPWAVPRWLALVLVVLLVLALAVPWAWLPGRPNASGRVGTIVS